MYVHLDKLVIVICAIFFLWCEMCYRIWAPHVYTPQGLEFWPLGVDSLYATWGPFC